MIEPGRGSESDGILRVDANFDGMTARPHVRVEAQRIPGRQPHLLPHQVHAKNRLGDRVLDLDARVHFDEVEVLFLVEQEL